jgi:O-antigen/teichoic acid export membrane protein
MAFAKWSIPRGFLGQLYGRFDVLLITLVLGSSATGVYAPAMQLTVPAAFLASSIASALNVKSSGLSSMNKSVAADLRNAFSYAGLIPIPILFGAFAFPEQLLEIIFGPSAGAGAEALIILAAFQLFRSYHYPLGVVLDGIDRPDIGFKILIVTLLINIPIALGLVQSFGIFGVALATAIAEGFRTVLSYAVVARVIGYPGIPRVLIKQLFAGSVMFTIIGIFKRIGITPTGSVSLSMVVGLGAVVYFTVLSSVSREFRTTATAILRQTIPERTT